MAVGGNIQSGELEVRALQKPRAVPLERKLEIFPQTRLKEQKKEFFSLESESIKVILEKQRPQAHDLLN